MIKSSNKSTGSIKILVTGGSGFIGTNLVEYLRSFGYTLKNIDINSPKNTKHKMFWENIDINDSQALSESLLKFDPNYIVHLAARTDLNGKSIEDYSANIGGVANLLEAVKHCKKLNRVIITSSMLVCKTGYSPKSIYDYNPDTYYGESKVETENITRNSDINCEWTIIRPTSIWGPYFQEPYKKFFDMVISKHYYHPGRMSTTKTYGYVGNSIFQIMKILTDERLKVNKQVFYIGDYQPYNIEDWSNEIAAELGYSIKRLPFLFFQMGAAFGDFLKTINIKFPITTFRLKNMTTPNCIDMTNIQRHIPKLPYTRLQGIRKTLDWMQSTK